MVAIKTSANFGEAIRLRRKALGLTQQQLAVRCGVGTRFIVDLESGKPSCQLGKALTAAAEVGLLLQSADQYQPENSPPPEPDDPLAWLPKF